MHKAIKAYLFEENTAVSDKSVIRNSKDEYYRDITLILSAEEIERYYEELQLLNEIGARGEN